MQSKYTAPSNSVTNEVFPSNASEVITVTQSGLYKSALLSYSRRRDLSICISVGNSGENT
jgi:hypothetical protein